MSIESASATTSPPAAGRLGWAVLLLLGLGAVAGAGWYGYERQRHDADTDRAGSPSAASGATVSGGRLAANDTPPPVTGPPPDPATRRRAPAAAPAGSSASQPVLRWPLWEFQLRQPIPPRDPPLTPPSWRLIGATLSADGWKVVVLRQGAPAPEYFGVGATLPGGYRIQAITDEDVTFAINKREVILSYTGSR